MSAFDDVYATDTEGAAFVWQSLQTLNACMIATLCIAWIQHSSPRIRDNQPIIKQFHIDQEPLFMHLFNLIAYCERVLARTSAVTCPSAGHGAIARPPHVPRLARHSEQSDESHR